MNEQNEQIRIAQDQNHLNDIQEPFKVVHWVTKGVFEGLVSFSVGRVHWSKEGKKGEIIENRTLHLATCIFIEAKLIAITQPRAYKNKRLE